MAIGKLIIAAAPYLRSFIQQSEHTGFYSESLSRQEETISELEREKEALKQKQEKNRNKQQKLFEEWIQQTEGLLKEIMNYRYELFIPGCMEEIQNTMDRAKELSKRNAKQDALSEAYHAYQLAAIIKMRLVDFEMDWERAYEEFLKRWEEIEEFMKQCLNWTLRISTEEGEEIVEIDVNYWTHGRLNELYERMPKRSISRSCLAEDIHRFITDADEIIAQMSELPSEAAAVFYDSQMRAELCETIYHAFLQRGWRLADGGLCGYIQGDDRNDIILQIQNPVEDRVVLVFSKNGVFRVSTTFHDIGNRDFQQHLSAVLLRILKEEGFLVTDFQNITA